MVNTYLPEACEIKNIIKETETEYTFTIATSHTPTYGQFVEVSIPMIGEAPISVSGFGEGWIDLTIRGAGCLTNEILKKSIGEMLFVRGPYGKSFPVDQFKGSPLIIAAGGSGVAPVRTLVRSRLDSQDRSITQLMFGFKNPSSILFTKEIEEWKQKCPTVVTVDVAEGGWSGPTGVITKHIPGVKLTDFSKTNVVVVGPPVMMKFTCAEFLLRKIPAENIWVSFERRMACGLGKCGHCKIDSTYVCIDGPVFNYTDALHLFD